MVVWQGIPTTTTTSLVVLKFSTCSILLKWSRIRLSYVCVSLSTSIY